MANRTGSRWKAALLTLGIVFSYASGLTARANCASSRSCPPKSCCCAAPADQGPTAGRPSCCRLDGGLFPAPWTLRTGEAKDSASAMPARLDRAVSGAPDSDGPGGRIVSATKTAESPPCALFLLHAVFRI